MIKDEKKYWVALNACYEIGPARLRRLYSFFPSMKDAWKASDNEWRKAVLEEKVIIALRETVSKVNPDEEMERLHCEKINVLTIKEKEFPQSLKNIDRPPAIIYLKGKIKKIDKIALSVVGTRRMSLYGRQVTEKIVGDLARSGMTIISGLARGVDTIAHESALEVGGRTIAVVGSGLDEQSLYPFDNLSLARKIVSSGGAIISEYHPKTPALAQHFPARNRLISALSLGVLVTECPIKSGALLTARAGLEQGKEIFAIPGDIRNENCEGTNNLIKMGAKAITCAAEVLEEFGFSKAIEEKIKKVIPETKEEAKILNFMSIQPIEFDQLVKKTSLDSATLSSVLTMMEIQGKVRNVGMNQYVLKK
jgi:DNA processing protein